MIFNDICILVLWTKVTSALEGLSSSCQHTSLWMNSIGAILLVIFDRGFAFSNEKGILLGFASIHFANQINYTQINAQ